MCLESILRIEQALAALRDDDSDRMGFADIVPSEREFISLRDLIKPLKVIKAAIDRFQGDEHPVIHMVVYHLLNIGSLSSSPNYPSCSPTTKKFVEAFEARLRLRLPNFGRNLREVCVANFLHPSFKGSLLNYKNDDQSFDATEQYIKDKFMVEQPDKESAPSASQPDIFASNPLDLAMDESGWGGLTLDMARAQVMAFESQQAGQERDQHPVERELQIWRDATPVSKDLSLDILEFWKGQESRLPLLASLAKDTLAIQVTSASSERVFSEGGNVVSKKRTLLNPENAEMLVFIHDNYDSLEPFIGQWKTQIKDFTYGEDEDQDIELGSDKDNTDIEEDEESQSLTRTQSLTPSLSQTPKGKGHGKGGSHKPAKEKDPEEEDDIRPDVMH